MIPLFKDPASGTEDTPNLRLALVYLGMSTITLNDPNDSPQDTYLLDDVAVQPVAEGVLENKQGKDGMEAFEVYKNALSLRLRGIIHAPTIAKLFDKAEALAYAFDPALLSRRTSDGSQGFRALQFNVPTEDVANFPSGLMPSFYYARPIDPITFATTKYEGNSVPFTIDMLCRDPRRYLQALSSRVGSGALDNLIADYPSWPTITIAMTGAGVADVGFENAGSFGGTKSIHVDLSGCVNGDVVTIDMERRLIRKNGAITMSMYVSGGYWEVEPKNNTQAYSRTGNNQGIGSHTITWYPAFVK